MDSRATTVERAYQLARSGKFRSITEIRHRLHTEGYVDANAQLSGRTLTDDLRRLLGDATRTGRRA
jgi:hypothetical protein